MIVIEARKALFEKHAHEEDEEDEEYSLDDLNLEGDAGAWTRDRIRFVGLNWLHPDADVWDADSEYLEFLAKEVSTRDFR